jgi:coenzyme F420-reducing hydrogenase delta subunit
MAADFEPKIVGFLCNWCSYAGADLAGVSRFQYPANLRIVRVMCSGRIEPSLILEMFIQGADGVFIGGCHLGDCHYQVGNYYAEKRIKLTKKLLDSAGIDPGRLKLEWIAAAEGQRFAETIRDFTEILRSLGPPPYGGNKPDVEILMKLFAAKNVAKDFRLKLLVAKEYEILDKGNVYNNQIPPEELDLLMDDVIEAELGRCRILLATKDKPRSVEDLAIELDIPSRKVLSHIVTLKDRGLISMERIEDDSPLYLSTTEEGI